MKTAVALCFLIFSANLLIAQQPHRAPEPVKPTSPESQQAERWLRDLSGNSVRDTDQQIIEIEIFGSESRQTSSGQYVRNCPTDHELSRLRQFARLKKLTIENYRVPDDKNLTDEGLSQIGSLTGLEQLSLGGLAITDAGLRELRDLRSLKRLVLRDLKLTKVGLAHLLEMPSLESLSLGSTPLTEAELIRLKKLASLRDLTLEQTGGSSPHPLRVKGDWATHFNDMPQLRSLGLEQTGITSAGVAKLRLPNVQTLTLAGGCIQAEQPETCECRCASEIENVDLRGCISLKSLNLSASRLVRIQGPPSLTSLRLCDSCIADSALADLKDLPALQHLEIQSVKISAAGLAPLESLDSLDSLTLDHVALTEQGFAVLGKLRNLRSLKLADTGVTKTGLTLLKQMKSLQHLDLWDTGLTETDAQQIREALHACTVEWDDSERYAP